MFLTKTEAAEIAAFVPEGREDLRRAIARATEPQPIDVARAIETIAVPRASTFDLEIPTAPVPPETMSALVYGSRPTRDL